MRGNGVPTICHGFKPFAPCKRTKGVNSPTGTFVPAATIERSGVLDRLPERGGKPRRVRRMASGPCTGGTTIASVLPRSGSRWRSAR